jgi:hypothetical protein
MPLPLPDLLCALVDGMRLGVCFCEPVGDTWLGIKCQQARRCQIFPVPRCAHAACRTSQPNSGHRTSSLMSRRCIAYLQLVLCRRRFPRELLCCLAHSLKGTPEGTVTIAHTGPFHGTHWRRGAEAVNAGSGEPLQCCVEECAACQEDRHRLQLEGELTVAREPCLLAVPLNRLRFLCISTERPLQPHVSSAGGGPHSWRDPSCAVWNWRRGVRAPRADLWRPRAHSRGAADAKAECRRTQWTCSSWA